LGRVIIADGFAIGRILNGAGQRIAAFPDETLAIIAPLSRLNPGILGNNAAIKVFEADQT
jgi:hypothetical protein